MIRFLLIALITSLLATGPRPATCACAAPAPGETTHYGGNELVTVRERKIYRSVQGVVRDITGEPVEGVLVEVFDRPEWILLNHPASRVKQRRIAACKTGPDGKFELLRSLSVICPA